jgi:hypothetical protein
MNDTRYPVTVAVTRPDGSIDHVRVGTAVKQGNGFSLQLGELAIGTPEPARRAAPSPSPPPPPPSAGGMTFPPYGRSKGAPIAGATLQDLEYYASGARRSLADASKSRWHDKERQLLTAIEAEIARQGGGGSPAPPASFQSPFDDGAPPRGDDDIPF